MITDKEKIEKLTRALVVTSAAFCIAVDDGIGDDSALEEFKSFLKPIAESMINDDIYSEMTLADIVVDALNSLEQ